MAKAFIFVRQKQTLLVLTPHGQWADALDQAHTFKSTWEAAMFCRQQSVVKAEIVMRMGDPIYDITIDSDLSSHRGLR